MHIKVKKGLDIPLAGQPVGEPLALPQPKQVSLNLDPFDDVRFKILVKPGQSVKIGQPLVESRTTPGLVFVSPGAGVLSEIRRGLKRRLIDLVIDLAAEETYEFQSKLDLTHTTREELMAYFLKSGLLPHMRMRPFDLVADPKYTPRDIFVSALESLPFVPSAELQIQGHENLFQIGLDTLRKITTGKVHLVYRTGSICKAFSEAQSVEKHTVTGPHPAGNVSLHIHCIAPIRNAQDHVWTLSVIDVITIGQMIKEGTYFTDRLISVAGEGVVEGRRNYFRGRLGFPISDLIVNRISTHSLRFISGDPLTGAKKEAQDFLNFNHVTLSVIPESSQRKSFHFLRLGTHKYSATKAYLTGHLKSPTTGYSFTTHQNGEERALVDGSVYDKVMPLKVPTAHLIKALLANDFETAEAFGLLEVTGDDFALPAFICPSKIEMIEIVKGGLRNYSKEMGY